MKGRTKAERRRRLIGEYQALWRDCSSLTHKLAEAQRTVLRDCAPDCPACPRSRELSASMQRKADEIRAVEREILDGGRRAGPRATLSDHDILRTYALNPTFTDERHAENVGLSSRHFAERKASLPPEYAAIIAAWKKG